MKLIKRGNITLLTVIFTLAFSTPAVARADYQQQAAKIKAVPATLVLSEQHTGKLSPSSFLVSREDIDQLRQMIELRSASASGQYLTLSPQLFGKITKRPAAGVKLTVSW